MSWFEEFGEVLRLLAEFNARFESRFFFAFVLFSIQWQILEVQYLTIKATMECLGFEPGTAGWMAHTDLLSYCDSCHSKRVSLYKILYQINEVLWCQFNTNRPHSCEQNEWLRNDIQIDRPIGRAKILQLITFYSFKNCLVPPILFCSQDPQF